MNKNPSDPPDLPLAGVAFLLTQIGTHAADRYAQRVAALELTPPQTGLLRQIAQHSGLSQQAVADRLNMPASRIVGLLDDLETRGFVERRRDPSDRRNHALHLTGSGEVLLSEIAAISRAHDADITANLDAHQRDTLRELLNQVAEGQGLTPGVHPGFRRVTGRGWRSD